MHEFRYRISQLYPVRDYNAISQRKDVSIGAYCRVVRVSDIAKKVSTPF